MQMNKEFFDRVVARVSEEGTLNSSFCSKKAFSLTQEYVLGRVTVCIRENIFSSGFVRSIFLDRLPVVVTRGSELDILDFKKADEAVGLALNIKENTARSIILQVIEDLELLKGTFVSRASVIKVLRKKMEELE